MTDDFANELRPPSKTNWLLTVVLVSIAGLGFGWFLRELANPQFPDQTDAPEPPHPSVGLRAPELSIEGWFNGEAVTAGELAGKVYVIDAWEFYCLPCLQYAPHTIELYEKYQDKGVVFFGLTSASGEKRLAKSREFLRRAEFPWPNAYGAADMLLKLYHSDDITVPQLWVVDKDGVIAWGGHPMGLKPELLDQLLAAEVKTSRQTPAGSEEAAAQTPSPGG